MTPNRSTEPPQSHHDAPESTNAPSGAIMVRNEKSGPKRQPIAITKDEIEGVIKNPLLQVPADWRPLVWDFWAGHSHLLKDMLALTTRLRWWIDDDGLTLEEFAAVARRLRRPESLACQANFASEVIAAIAADITQLRRERERTKQRRAQHEAFRRDIEAATRSRAAGEIVSLADTLGEIGNE